MCKDIKCEVPCVGCSCSSQVRASEEPLIRVRVACLTSLPDALFCIEQRKHKDAELAIQVLDSDISKMSIAEETLFACIQASEADFEEEGITPDEETKCIEFEDRCASYLDEYIDKDIISLQEAREYWSTIHQARMNLYTLKEFEKSLRKKAFHAMKRLSYQVSDKTCNKDFIKAYEYYLSVAK